MVAVLTTPLFQFWNWNNKLNSRSRSDILRTFKCRLIWFMRSWWLHCNFVSGRPICWKTLGWLPFIFVSQNCPRTFLYMYRRPAILYRRLRIWIFSRDDDRFVVISDWSIAIFVVVWWKPYIRGKCQNCQSHHRSLMEGNVLTKRIVAYCLVLGI